MRAGRACRAARCAALLLAAVTAALPAAPAAAREIRLPEDGLEWRRSDLPGYALVQKQCRGCHSAHYAAYQPPGSPRAYWEAQVKRMKSVFHADIPDEQIPTIVEYLVHTYGVEAHP